MKDLNVFTEQVEVIGVRALDFKTNDGNLIRGYKVFYSRALGDSEKETTFGRMMEYKFLQKETLDDIDKYKNKIYPCKATIKYEIVSLNSLPKVKEIIF